MLPASDAKNGRKMAKMFCLWCKYETQCVLKALCTLRKALCKDNLPIFYYDYFVLKAVKKTGELPPKTWNYQPMLHNIAYARPYGTLTRPQFWLTRQACAWNDVKWLTGSLRWQVWLKIAFYNCLCQRHETAYTRACAWYVAKVQRRHLTKPSFFCLRDPIIWHNDV